MVKALTPRFVYVKSQLDGREMTHLLGHVTSNPFSPSDCFSDISLAVAYGGLPPILKPTVAAESINGKYWRIAYLPIQITEDEDDHWKVVIIRKIRHFRESFDGLSNNQTFSQELSKIFWTSGTAYMVTSTYSVLELGKTRLRLADEQLPVLGSVDIVGAPLPAGIADFKNFQFENYVATGEKLFALDACQIDPGILRTIGRLIDRGWRALFFFGLRLNRPGLLDDQKELRDERHLMGLS